nr:XrtA system polysaccharide deacetylase [Rhodothalassium salexigens]
MLTELERAQPPGEGTVPRAAPQADAAGPRTAAMADRHAMTVDVEDYFQVSAMEPRIDRADWGGFECRVERNVDTLLALFDDHGVDATFFTLGWIAERYPAMMRRIADAGHEIASHGCHHHRVSSFSQAAFRHDVQRAKAVLEDVTGQAVRGYRAPSFSIDERTPWAHETLADTGHVYSSSVHPIAHDHYGMPDAPRGPYRPVAGSDFLEVPVTTVELAGRRLPCGGGGWFRLLPYAYSAWGLRRATGRDGLAAVFYFHPWEIDPGQPRVDGLSLKTRVRHYTNLGRMQPRLARLLTAFDWTRMDRLFCPALGGEPAAAQSTPATVTAGP